MIEVVTINNEEQLEQLKKNIVSLSYSIVDAPYFGVNKDQINGIEFAINKILENTGILIGDLINEMYQKKWFSR